jgi:hypothetical protein
LFLYDATDTDSVEAFHNGPDLRVNCTNTRWIPIRGADVLQLDADTAGTSPVPGVGATTLNHAMSVTSTTDGDSLGFLVYNADGTNNPRAAFFMDDTAGTWGNSLTWSSSAPKDWVISMGGTTYVTVPYSYNATGVTSGMNVFDHTGTARPVGFNTMRRIYTNQSITLNAECAGNWWYRSNTTSYAITTEASTSTDFPVDAVFTLYNAGNGGTVSITPGTGTTIRYFTGSSITDKAAGAGSWTLGYGGVATLVRYSATYYFLSGSGIS